MYSYSDVERIAHALGKAKKNKDGYQCLCPAHEDENPSLGITLSKDNELIFNCLAGCNWKDIKEECVKKGLIEPFKPTKQATSLTPTYKPRQHMNTKTTYYEYKDQFGNPVGRVVKIKNLDTDTKKVWVERFTGTDFVPGLNGIKLPLYNLQATLSADVVYLTEGEGKCDTLNAVGLVATTNPLGASSWAPQYTEHLKGKTVILCIDNDEPGRKRVGMLTRALAESVKELRVFNPPVKEVGEDVDDWVKKYGGDPLKIFEMSTAIEKKEASKKATREDYYRLFDEILDSPRKCIFAEKLMYKNKVTDLWNPCINAIEILKSEALARNESNDSKFNIAHIQPHLACYENTKQTELLVDIPEWDWTDRISEMAYLMKLKPEAGISELSFSELLKEWCALVFKRLEDPMIQNRILVLQGGQGIGKDTWTSMLCDGLGQFCIPLNVVGEDKDTYLSLHRGLIMKISEFDKTARVETSTLKDLITAPSTNVRAPYDKDSKVRLSRCSFISSANAEQLLRDSTGNRRFMIFEVDRIEYAYHDWSKEKIVDWQMQCLAEMKVLAQKNYTASEKAWREMREYIESKTPEDFDDDIADHFLQVYRARTASELVSTSNEVDAGCVLVREILVDLAKQHGVKYTTVRNAIKTKFLVQKRIGSQRPRILRLPDVE